MPAVDSELAHGYTLADLTRIARSATLHAGQLAADFGDRYETAWSAIAEALYAAEQPPAEPDLWHAGRDAIWQAIRDDRRTHGAARHDGHMPAFARYWWDHASAAPSCENQVVERLALRQIWPHLTPAHRSALAAYAALGTLPAAAEALGISVRAYNSRLQRARQLAAQLWHEHETPARNRRRDYRPRADRDHLRPCGTPTAYARHRRRGEPVDTTCRRAWTRYQAERAAARAGAAPATAPTRTN